MRRLLLPPRAAHSLQALQSIRSLSQTLVLLRVGSHKGTTPAAPRDPTTHADEQFRADVVPKTPGMRIPVNRATPESTVVRRPTTRKAFGNRVNDEMLFSQDFDRTLKDGLIVNVEIHRADTIDKPDTMRPVGKPSELGKGGRFWEKRRLQPLNPHYDLNTYQSKKLVKRIRDGTTLFTSRDRLNHSHKLTDDQVDKFADNYVSTKWYRFVWRAMRRFDLQNLKRYTMLAQIGAAVSFTIMAFIGYSLYWHEIDIYHQLEKREQDDLRKVLHGMRMSQFKAFCDEFFERTDPLRTMGDKERWSLVVEEFRREGLVNKDWELEKRKRPSLIQQPDLYHIMYWSCMYFGSLLGGGGMGFWNGLDM